MSTSDIDRLREIRTFPSLVKYLRDELDWPVESVEDFEDLTFDWSPEELGIDLKTAAKIESIKQLRPLTTDQPWGIFFVKFEPKRLPVVALRRILGRVVVKKRASASSAERASWEMNDLLFISNYGEGEERQISLAHFSQEQDKKDLPVLKVLGWDNRDTPLHLDHVASELQGKLAWPTNEEDIEGWRETWGSAFTLRHREVITTSKELALRLAELARSIRTRIGSVLAVETEKGPVTKLMKAFKEALVHDLTEDDFADMYAQTIAYGLLTARISRPAGLVADNIADMVPITNPFLKELLETFLDIGGRRSHIDFDELGVNEVVALLNNPKTQMEAILRDFGDKNPQEDPVIHFYELFLKEYDAKKRMQRGVFYTPRPVVSYIVRSVDELLRTEFALKDGLADTTTWGEMANRFDNLEIPEGATPDQTFVQILDPATGTGTFLVEVIGLINKTMTEKWQAEGHGAKKIEQLWNEYVPTHLLPRLHGYELMMAPYAIAHMKIGLKLYETGYRFECDERARVYLTNSLEPPQDFSGTLAFAIPALAHEAEAVNAVKKDQRFTVVIGNPPYSIMSANLSPACRMLVDSFRSVNGKKVVEKSAIVLERTLQDDYVKFYALADQLVCASLAGLLGFISNSSFLENINLRGMRWKLLSSYQRIQVLDLHGDIDRKETAPSGEQDKNVFDIKKGVSILIALKHPGLLAARVGLFRSDLMGARIHKYSTLMNSSILADSFKKVAPRPEMYSFAAADTSIADEFARGISISKLFVESATGIETGKDLILVAFRREELRQRLLHFGDPTVRDSDIRKEFDAEEGCGRVIADLRKSIPTDPELHQRLQPFTFAPFDTRWVFYRKDVINVHSYSVVKHLLDGKNVVFIAMRQVALNKDFSHFFVTRHITNNRAFYSTRGKAYMLPLWLHEGGDEFLLTATGKRPNLSKSSIIKLCADAKSVYGHEILPNDVMAFVYAVTHSPSYRSRYDGPLRSDYPHVPVPSSGALFDDLARLGGELVDLHLMESPKLDDFITTYTGPKNPEVGRVGWSEGTVWLDAGKTSAREGHRATKPGTIGFHGVPEEVWDFHIGGYQVCHKWLKDRKGRTLSDDDLAHYQKIVVALNETIRIMAEIDVVIDQHGGWPDAFVTKK